MSENYKPEMSRLILTNFENDNSELRKLASSFKVRRIWLNTKKLYTINPAKPTPKDDNKNKKKQQKEE